MHPDRQASRLGPNPLGRPILVKGTRLLSQQPAYRIADPVSSLQDSQSTHTFQRPQEAIDHISQTGGRCPEQRLVSIQPSSFPQQIEGAHYRAHNNHSVPIDGLSTQSRRRITSGVSQISRPATGDFWDQIVPRRPQVFPELRAQRALAATRQRIEDLQRLHQRQDSNTHCLVDSRLQNNTTTEPNTRRPVGRPGNPSKRHIPVLVSQNYDDIEENTIVDIHKHKLAQRNETPIEKRTVRDTTKSPKRITNKQRASKTSDATTPEDNFIVSNISLVGDTKYYNGHVSENSATCPWFRENPSTSQGASQANKSSEAIEAFSNEPGPNTTDELHVPQLGGSVEQTRGDCDMLAIEKLLVKTFGERIKDDEELWDLIDLYVGGS